jgi:hypothetical protein
MCVKIHMGNMYCPLVSKVNGKENGELEQQTWFPLQNGILFKLPLVFIAFLFLIRIFGEAMRIIGH